MSPASGVSFLVAEILRHVVGNWQHFCIRTSALVAKRRYRSRCSNVSCHWITPNIGGTSVRIIAAALGLVLTMFACSAHPPESEFQTFALSVENGNLRLNWM